MPELPEVETTRHGIAPFIEHQSIKQLVLRRQDLRWPIPKALPHRVAGQTITHTSRRAKYLLLHVQTGAMILHLGMSGSLRILPSSSPAAKHDHFDIQLSNEKTLRFHDPRRFGALLWQPEGHIHPLLQGLGPEPLDANFDGAYLWQASRGRHQAIKNFLMNQHIVVGIGNIYASEALFLAGIHPQRKVNAISKARYQTLAACVQEVLAKAIEAGGTSMRDFTHPDGKPGYFAQELWVYGRQGQPCRRCAHPIRARMIGQRNSFYCPNCQH